MKESILVIGSNGMVGSRFVELYKDKFQICAPPLNEFNLLDTKLMSLYLKKKKIESIINFAAFTDVGEGEKQRNDKESMCWKINVEGIKNLTKLIGKSIYLIHISTDMVFTGSKDDQGPYKEKHEVILDPDKLSWYGYTKGIGEDIIKNTLGNYSILRLIYPVRARFIDKLDYLRKPLKLYKEGNLYPLFNDQKISITFIDQACETIYILLKRKFKGIFHCSSKDTTTPHELISYLIEAKYGKKIKIKHKKINEFLKESENPLRYPVYGGLDTKFTESKLRLRFLSWKEIVDELVRQNIDT